MKRLAILPLCTLIATFLGFPFSVSAAENAPVFRAGAATSVITPPLGVGIVGGFGVPLASHVHDELHARCLVLDDGKTKIALVVCDLLGVHRSVAAQAKEYIEKELGIPPSHVAVSAVHAHSGPNSVSTLDMIRSYHSDMELSDYQRFLARRIADGVRRAANLLRPAEMSFGHIEIPEHVFNRRWFLKEGTMPENPFGKSDELVKMNPASGTEEARANLLKPAGPVDPRVSIMVFREPDGKPIALYSAYSLHYVGGVQSTAISADYYGYYCRAVERILSTSDQEPAFVAMMANGTSGDVNNTDFAHAKERHAPYERMKIVADDIATKVTKAVEKFQWKAEVSLDAAYEEMDNVAWRKVPDDLLEWAKKTAEGKELDPKKPVMDLIYAKRLLHMNNASPKTKFPVHAVRIGDVCMGMAGCEVFAEIGMEFRTRSPFQNSFMVSLTDAYWGYMPSPRHFSYGGYETWPGTNMLEERASVKMLDAILGMAQKMKSSK